MNKDSFLRQLECLLMDPSEEEREAALEYYTDYFEEAGPEREEEWAKRLGTPEKVAAELKTGLFGDREGGEFSERGYRDERFSEEQILDQYTQVYSGEVIDEKERTGSAHRQEYYDEDAEERSSQKSRKLLVLILLVIFGFPVFGSLSGVLFSVLGVFLGFAAVVIAAIICGIAAVCALFSGGIGMIIAGICNLPTVAIGVMTIGFGFLMIAASFLVELLVEWGCRTAVPWMVRLCIRLVKRAVTLIKDGIVWIFGKRGTAR